MQQRIALFTGSFDPFTTGHHDIVERALPLFDKLVIGVGINPRKHCMFTAEQRLEAIKALYRDNPKIEVYAYDDMATDLAQRVGARFIVKGVRNTADFEYERVQAEFNKRLGGVETVLLYTRPELECVSSSAVRELIYFNKDISEYIPKHKQTR